MFLFLKKDFAWFTIAILLLASCTATNNLYVNDPAPVDKGSGWSYVGVGMGLTPRIDTILNNGEVISHGLKRTVNLCLGGRYGITNRFSIGGSIYFPDVICGFGMNIRPQLSFFDQDSYFNMAVSADFGFALPKDTLRISDEFKIPFDNETKGAINFDLAVPMSFRLNDDIRFIITPRYSRNAIYLRERFESSRKKPMFVKYPCLSLGLKISGGLFETSVMRWNNRYMYFFGVVFVFE